ncbi:MAG TPA: hypothetical protein VMS55_13045 [Myxococcota bacterium]|nr:hypothetical protein [Myxococcota bacterium]
MDSLRLRTRMGAIGFGLLALAIHPEAARAQAQAIPFSSTNIPLSTASPTFTVNLNMLTAPDRPQLRVIATPDAGHSNMTLQIQVDQCPLFGSPDNCFVGSAEAQPWASPSAPGAVNWVAPVWQCMPAPRDANITGDPTPECRVQVTATNFGSGGSPAHFNLQIQGETKPVTGTAQTVVNPAGGTVDGNLPFDRVPFCTDAANFRWIYDANHDFTLETFQPTSHARLGTCSINPADITPDNIYSLPYHYAYVGSPSYVGFDCCTWQMDSLATGTTGSGQALFFINKSLASPPPDTDGDGFFDPCDNCVNVPNGPFLGTCVTPDGSAVGGPCLSNQQCTGGKFCSMAQEDNDFDPTNGGLVCLPEPGATTLLASGVLCLVVLERRRRRSVSLRASC